MTSQDIVESSQMGGESANKTSKMGRAVSAVPGGSLVEASKGADGSSCSMRQDNESRRPEMLPRSEGDKGGGTGGLAGARRAGSSARETPEFEAPSLSSTIATGGINAEVDAEVSVVGRLDMYDGTYVPYDGTYGTPDQGQTLDV